MSTPDSAAPGVRPGPAADTPMDADSMEADIMDADTMARRWRLALGADGGGGAGAGVRLTRDEAAMDAALAALYDVDATSAGRLGGHGASAPKVATWLGDIRTYFPTSVVKVMQGDAIERLGLQQLLLEPETMRSMQPDVHLVATLVNLKHLIPQQSRETARQVVAAVVAEVERKLADRTRAAVSGALNRANRTRRPKPRDIDWPRTIQANLKNYLPEQRTVVPERLVGYARHQNSLQREVVLCVDQSGSMAGSVVYSSIFACVLASLRSLRTHLVVYDTAVVDLTDQLSDPVEVIFGTQLGGGTDTCPALDHCRNLIARPGESVLILISDLYDSDPDEMVRRLAAMKRAGITVIVLLALDDQGRPSFHHGAAAQIAELGIPAFGCTPDEFPDLIAAALRGDDLVGHAERTMAERTH